MRVVSILLLSLAVALGAPLNNWFTAYNLTAQEQTILTKKGCFRGNYVPNLSLHTCGGDSPFAQLEASTALCVVELKSTDSVARRAAVDLVKRHSDCSELVLELPQHIIIKNGNGLPVSEFSELCSVTSFKDQADNVLFVPREAILPQIEMNYSSLRAYQRARDAAVMVDPNIEKLLAQFNRKNVENNVKWFSTGTKGDNTGITRNSWSTKIGSGGCADATWRCAFTVVNELVDQINTLLVSSGRSKQGWTVEALPFSSSYCSNVRVIVPSSSEKVVVIGAHLDSRNVASGSNAVGVAPGADDNGTGSAVLLEILRTMAEGVYNFQEQVHLLWFCGEEQGLLGSAALATDYQNAKTQIVGMFNNDMIGYTDSTYGVTVSFVNRNSDTTLTEECKKFATLYMPSLAVGTTTACCSDQQSFFQKGFRAAGIFETPTTGVKYPEYHTSKDTYDNGLINYEQVWLFGKANLACILEYAVPV